MVGDFFSHEVRASSSNPLATKHPFGSLEEHAHRAKIHFYFK